MSGTETTGIQAPSRAEYCVVACAEAWRDAGEVLASPMGTVPAIGARLARLTFSPNCCSRTGRHCSSPTRPRWGRRPGTSKAGCHSAST